MAAANATTRVEALQHRQSMTAQQRVDLERMGKEKTELERQFRVLSGLRSGAAAGDMFVTVDRALTSDDVWFLNWEFERAGVVINDDAQTVNTGYFIVVPDGAAQRAPDELRVQTHMTIQGQARDHSTLSGFVRRLFAQPEVDDVRIRRTSRIRNDQVNAVDFVLSQGSTQSDQGFGGFYVLGNQGAEFHLFQNRENNTIGKERNFDKQLCL